jgi:RimJ/RimL family protein N-acetyltransferase
MTTKTALNVVPYDPVHMEFIDFHAQFAEAASREDPHVLARSMEAWTFLDPSGDVIAIVGVMETHSRVAYLWTFMSKQAGSHMLAITRFMLKWLGGLACVRIEATVLKDFKEAHRWMRMLGFRRETTRPMKRWDGINDFHLYGRIAR